MQFEPEVNLNMRAHFAHILSSWRKHNPYNAQGSHDSRTKIAITLLLRWCQVHQHVVWKYSDTKILDLNTHELHFYCRAETQNLG